MDRINNTATRFLEACEEVLSGYDQNQIRKSDGTKFEKLLVDVMKDVIELYPVFRGVSVEAISGQRFPDIVVTLLDGSRFGVEVKTTTSDRWTSMGGSIFESTRVEGVCVIFLFFAKLGGNLEYRYGPHERFLKDVKITHSPRYTIDMMLQPGQTIFDQISMSYDAVRRLDNPFRPFRSLMLKRHGAGADVWWVGDEYNGTEMNTAPLVFRAYSDLDGKEQAKLIAEVCALIPEVFTIGGTGRSTKYSRVSTYLAARYKVVDHALRDRFSAGGTFQYKNYTAVPKVLKRLTDRNFLVLVREFLLRCDPVLIQEYWYDYEVLSHKDFFEQWIMLVNSAVGAVVPEGGIPTPVDMINDCLNGN